jgi:hypothetical protein
VTSCGLSHELLSSIRGEEFDQLSDYQLARKDCALCTYFCSLCYTSTFITYFRGKYNITVWLCASLFNVCMKWQIFKALTICADYAMTSCTGGYKEADMQLPWYRICMTNKWRRRSVIMAVTRSIWCSGLWRCVAWTQPEVATCFPWFLAWLTVRPWRWWWYGPPKC